MGLLYLFLQDKTYVYVRFKLNVRVLKDLK